MLKLNESVAVDVTQFSRIKGDLVVDADLQAEYYTDLGAKPGIRLDVQAQCIDNHPDLATFVVDPNTPDHDCGANGVRLFADTMEELQAAAPPTGSIWDVFVEALDETSV